MLQYLINYGNNKYGGHSFMSHKILDDDVYPFSVENPKPLFEEWDYLKYSDLQRCLNEKWNN